jgi:hypothetical protein
MYGLAERRRRYEIVFKNAKKNSATRCTPGRRKVCGPVAAACNEPEVHVLSPCFYYRYRSTSCFDGAVLTYLDLYIFKTIVSVLGGSEKRGSQSCPIKPLRKPATEESENV